VSSAVPALVRALLRSIAAVGLTAVVAACGGGLNLLHHGTKHSSTSSEVTLPGPSGGGNGAITSGVGSTQKLSFPAVATKNTTRVPGTSPIVDAAQVALAVYPSAVPGTHPSAVVLAPVDDWEASLAASALMAQPIRAPLLFSTATSIPQATSQALGVLAPTGDKPTGGAQVIRVGNVASPPGLRPRSIPGNDPYTLAAGIDRLIEAVDGRPSINVVIASSTSAAYAMPAASWAAESGEPILFVDGGTIPAVTSQELLTHHHPHIYVLGPPSVIPDSVLTQLGHYGKVRRVGGADPVANAIAFAKYRDPPCPSAQQCLHVPGSFGWAMTTPGHGYVIMNDTRTLDAAAASALSSSGSYGPGLLVAKANALPSPLLGYLCTYALPGYSKYGPTQAFYDHVWMIGDTHAISVASQAAIDAAVEIRPVSSTGSCG
jgi:hypothetical protein